MNGVGDDDGESHCRRWAASALVVARDMFWKEMRQFVGGRIGGVRRVVVHRHLRMVGIRIGQLSVGVLTET